MGHGHYTISRVPACHPADSPAEADYPLPLPCLATRRQLPDCEIREEEIDVPRLYLCMTPPGSAVASLGYRWTLQPEVGLTRAGRKRISL